MTPAATDSREVAVDCDGIRIAAEIRGEGTPVLLLHGYPESRAMWRAVGAVLAETHTVVAADLRGYGDSAAPAGDVYDKRAMAHDQLLLMRELGFDRFAVIGHDRGGRVAHRLALDAPTAVAAIAVLDIVPTLHMFEHVDREMATAYFHWFFLARGGGMPEALIEAAPDTWLASRFAGRHAADAAWQPDAYAEYARCFDTATIRASCADYRAAATVDLEHDRVDREVGHVIQAPAFALWGDSGYVGRSFDVLAAWRPAAPDITGHGIAADHYLPEEAPVATAAALAEFLRDDRITW